MHKLYILAILMFLGLALAWGLAYAQEESPAAPTLLGEETVSAQDLGVAEPGLLPGSPFYFFKNITRGARKLFTFDPVKKAELELKFADEKIAEAKKVAEVSPERADALERAVDNYRRSQEELKSRLTALKETSQNPNMDRLLEKLADRAVKHEKLVEELKTKFEENQGLREKLDQARLKIEEAVVQAAQKDEAQNFAGRIEKALVESKGGELKHLRSVEIIERLQEKAPGELKDRLAEIRNDFSMRLKEDLEDLAEKHQEAAPELIQKTLEDLPGDKARRLVIIGELRNLVAPSPTAMPAGIPGTEKRVKEALAGAEEILGKTLEERPDADKLAREALERSQNLLLKLEEKIKEMTSGLPPAAGRLADEARRHLEKARGAYESKKFGEALGQARSAEVLLRNAFRILEETKVPKGEDLRIEISAMEERLAGWEQRLERLSEELRPKAKEILASARTHLRLAAEVLTQADLAGAKKHLEEAKSFLRALERIFEDSRREDEALRRKIEEMEKCGPKPAAPGNWVCQDGSWRLLEEKPTSNIPPTDAGGGVKKCGVNTFQVLEECGAGGFMQMYVQCYDGYEEKPRSEQCQSSEEWQKHARSVCENRCNVSPSPKPIPMPFPGPKPTPNQTPLSPPKPGLAEPTPPSLKSAPTNVVCTEEYLPVCGINGKTYSNTCHAKVAGVEIKYRGECAKPEEETSIKPLPLPSLIPIPLPYLAPKPATETNAPTDQMR